MNYTNLTAQEIAALINENAADDGRIDRLIDYLCGLLDKEAAEREAVEILSELNPAKSKKKNSRL